ncbi:MAG: hypothetical protein HC808_11715 [Candidatus Competibacteraceae bacterium]|nr:hypothetical protein [Candidatus Competibacteraceae bacterium]
MAKPATIIILGMLLWISQMLLVIHELDHLAEQDAQDICTLCLAANGLDQPVAGTNPLTTLYDSLWFPCLHHSDVHLEAYFIVQARGPPSGLIG